MFYDICELIQVSFSNLFGLISDIYEWVQRMHLVQYFFGFLFLCASSVPFFEIFDAVFGYDLLLLYSEWVVRFVPWLAIIFAFSNWETIYIYTNELKAIKRDLRGTDLNDDEARVQFLLKNQLYTMQPFTLIYAESGAPPALHRYRGSDFSAL